MKELLGKLASSLGRRDEVPNQELAKEIVKTKDKKAVNILAENLKNARKDIQNDCIKVLYEIGANSPDLIATYASVFLEQLKSKNNRLQWGAMMALNSISTLKPHEIYDGLPNILDAVDKGSVITRDSAMNILINLCREQELSEDVFSLFIEQLLKSPVNQIPMYAERALPIINESNQKRFISALNIRLKDIEKASKQKRVEKIINKLLRTN